VLARVLQAILDRKPNAAEAEGRETVRLPQALEQRRSRMNLD